MPAAQTGLTRFFQDVTGFLILKGKSLTKSYRLSQKIIFILSIMPVNSLSAAGCEVPCVVSENTLE
jgi:hypothetical protein